MLIYVNNMGKFLIYVNFMLGTEPHKRKKYGLILRKFLSIIIFIIRLMKIFLKFFIILGYVSSIEIH
jgi:hypothetical protein